MDRNHNVYDTPMLPPDSSRERHARKLTQHNSVVLNDAQRGVVRETIIEVCEHRHWTIHELAVRSNHVHIVVSAPLAAERVMADLKAWATRRLREAGLTEPGMRVWAHHGSTRYIWKPKDIRESCNYVLDGQGPDI